MTFGTCTRGSGVGAVRPCTSRTPRSAAGCMYAAVQLVHRGALAGWLPAMMLLLVPVPARSAAAACRTQGRRVWKGRAAIGPRAARQWQGVTRSSPPRQRPLPRALAVSSVGRKAASVSAAAASAMTRHPAAPCHRENSGRDSKSSLECENIAKHSKIIANT